MSVSQGPSFPCERPTLAHEVRSVTVISIQPSPEAIAFDETAPAFHPAGAVVSFVKVFPDVETCSRSIHVTGTGSAKAGATAARKPRTASKRHTVFMRTPSQIAL